MRKIFFYVNCVCVTAALLVMSSCRDSKKYSPEVTKIQTVEEYNSIKESVDEMMTQSGYFSNSNKANTSYSYVLFDSHRKCIPSNGDGAGFRTEKNSKNDKIYDGDICINCGRRWDGHELW